jgi:hypothetical protein
MIKKLFLFLYFYYVFSFSFTPSLLKLKCQNDYLNNKPDKSNKVDKPFHIRNKLTRVNYDNIFIDAVTKNIKKAYIPAMDCDRIIFENNNKTKKIYLTEELKNIDKIIEILLLSNYSTIVYVSNQNFFNSVYSDYYYKK